MNYEVGVVEDSHDSIRMKTFLKVLTIFLVLAIIFAFGFALWGDQFDRLFSQEACTRWFIDIRPYGWAVGIGLLVSDLILPIPATGIMAALGNVYGWLTGGLIAAVGSAGAGIVGYAVARFMGTRATGFLASDKDIGRFKAFFDKWGGAAIIVSRAMPILPEVVSILAGLARMNITRFIVSLLLGAVPTCLLFSYLGYATRTEPWYGMIVAVIAPLAIWPIFLKVVSPRD